GLPNAVYPVTAKSDGVLPELDIVICFYISASIDDFTNVCLFNRYQTASADTNTAKAYSVKGFNGYSIVAQNNLYTAVNASNP
ncbi:hypothetical protein ABTD08_20220, partial [Acinetobacter baumannii]